MAQEAGEGGEGGGGTPSATGGASRPSGRRPERLAGNAAVPDEKRPRARLCHRERSKAPPARTGAIRVQAKRLERVDGNSSHEVVCSICAQRIRGSAKTTWNQQIAALSHQPSAFWGKRHARFRPPQSKLRLARLLSWDRQSCRFSQQCRRAAALEAPPASLPGCQSRR